jgi:N-acetylneuraminate epimerase
MTRPLVLTFLAFVFLTNHTMSSEPLHWDRLPDIPDAQGFAAPFAGVSGSALLLAGGANITGDKWSEPLHKKWYDSIFVLERPGGIWKSGFHLPHACAYGVSITVPEGVACLGGSDATGHFSDAFILRWDKGEIHRMPLPSLPTPCANACGALVGHTLYLAGGSESPTAEKALHTFWALDLSKSPRSWQELPPWPGPARILAVAGSADGSFFLFSGAEIKPGPQGKPVRTYLTDAYAYSPEKGWKRIADLPRPAVAAPSPALPFAPDEIDLVSGDDGKNVTFEPVKNHPGFPHSLLIYHLSMDKWETRPDSPISRATAPTVAWGGGFAILNGEVRPRVRTPEVWLMSTSSP